MSGRQQRRILFASGGLVLTLACAPSAFAADAPGRAATQELCSKEGLMQLVPQFKNADGKFQIPNPEKDLPTFLAAQQGLSNAIDMLLAQANAAGDPARASTVRSRPLTFGAHWRAAEVGIQTDGKKVSFVDPDFASYGGPSFLEGLAPITQSQGVFYAINQDGGVPGLVYPLPTALPCVNRLTLATANSAGSWLPPSYALGPEGGEAFLIVNICQDLGKPTTVGGTSVLGPNAELFLAFQWADTPDMAAFKSAAVAHRH